MIDHTIGRIARFGELYKRDHLSAFQKTMLEKNWYLGLSLLLSHSFYQGRTDEVFERVEAAVRSVLDFRFTDSDFAALTNCDLDEISRHLAMVLGKGKIGKERDARMVIEILRYARRLPGGNVALHSKHEIERGRICVHYEDLMKITQIGPKIAAFYLRDLVDVFDLETKLTPEDLKFLQPIDVWVRRVAQRLGIASDSKASDEALQLAILGACRTAGVSAFRFNQGAWYLGKNAFTLLIKNLDNIQPTI